MRRATLTFSLIITICQLLQIHAKYLPLLEYAGYTFFDRWGFYANVDNTTWGNVTYVSDRTARARRLVYTNTSTLHAIIKVDDTTEIDLGRLIYRDTIRMTSLESYGVGSLVIIDVVHIPYGCSVWPSFWTYGLSREWPNAGEIDIIEGINAQENNQIALHALPGCIKAEIPGAQTGLTLETNCSSVKGCIVRETKPNSYGPGFARAGGGVYAMQFATTGISVWFWSRPDIPTNVKNATNTSSIDTNEWGIPTASYPTTQCNSPNFTYYFPPQNLVLVTTLCGAWAGDPGTYQSTCNGSCIANVAGSGENYEQAYWEIKYIRAYYDETMPPQTTSASLAPTISAVPSQFATSDSLISRHVLSQIVVALGSLFLFLGVML